MTKGGKSPKNGLEIEEGTRGGEEYSMIINKGKDKINKTKKRIYRGNMRKSNKEKRDQKSKNDKKINRK